MPSISLVEVKCSEAKKAKCSQLQTDSGMILFSRNTSFRMSLVYTRNLGHVQLILAPLDARDSEQA